MDDCKPPGRACCTAHQSGSTLRQCVRTLGHDMHGTSPCLMLGVGFGRAVHPTLKVQWTGRMDNAGGVAVGQGSGAHLASWLGSASTWSYTVTSEPAHCT